MEKSELAMMTATTVHTACLLLVLATLFHFPSACPRYTRSLLVSLPSNAEIVLL
jgi:hypothetical protein